jgi:type IV secretory pathway VirB10-like protein
MLCPSHFIPTSQKTQPYGTHFIITSGYSRKVAFITNINSNYPREITAFLNQVVHANKVGNYV